MRVTKTHKRWLFAALFVLLTLVEVLLALFVRDSFFRPYGGDILVVGVLYCLVRIVLPDGLPWLPAALFLLAAGVEVLQYWDFVRFLGPLDTPFFRILLGGTFDWMDILCYGAGCALLGVIEGLRRWLSRKGRA